MRRGGARRRQSAALRLCIAALVVVSTVPWSMPADADPAATYADEPLGAARGTTGGGTGPVVYVTSLADNGAGTLRELAPARGPRVVRFAVSGQISLKRQIDVGSNVTLDGRGADVRLVGSGLKLDGVENVIVRNLRFSKGLGKSIDAISVTGGSKRVWIDHNELESFQDGLIDVTDGSTAVTISWNVVRDQGKAMLLGAGVSKGSPPMVDITMHNNLLQRNGERNPFMRHGRLHMWNNVVEEFGYSKDSGGNIRVGCGGIVLYDANVVRPGPNVQAFGFEDKACDPDRNPALVVSECDLGALEPKERRPELVPARREFTDGHAVRAADESLVSAVREGAGWHQLTADFSVPATSGPPNGGAPRVDGGDEDGSDGPSSGRTFVLAGLLVVAAMVIAGAGIRFERSRRSRRTG